jgi:hypothetical protein
MYEEPFMYAVLTMAITQGPAILNFMACGIFYVVSSDSLFTASLYFWSTSYKKGNILFLCNLIKALFVYPEMMTPIFQNIYMVNVSNFLQNEFRLELFPFISGTGFLLAYHYRFMKY